MVFSGCFPLQTPRGAFLSCVCAHALSITSYSSKVKEGTGGSVHARRVLFQQRESGQYVL